MKFRKLQINVNTIDGLYGTSLNFPDGLVVIWAGNSMGKSTCAKSILVVLGLEAMLTTSRQDLPLPPAMVSKIFNEIDNNEYDVISSEILLEIENNKGDTIVVSRSINGEDNKDLIRVYNGPMLTTGDQYEIKEYFINRSGAATRDVGFHNFLAKFLNWELPTVQTYDGKQVLLYLQCIFPFFITEQTRSWSTIFPPVPTQFRIRDVHKRAIEFILDMDCHQIILNKQELHFSKNQLEMDWQNQFRKINELASEIGAIIKEIPKNPVSTLEINILENTIVLDGDRWNNIEDYILNMEEKYNKLIDCEIRKVSDVIDINQEELKKSEYELQNKQSFFTRILEIFENEKQEIFLTRKRLIAIEEDIIKNKDAQSLRSLGASKNLVTHHDSCPICNQPIIDSLIPFDSNQKIMSLDENIKFLKEQKDIFSILLIQSENVFNERNVQIFSLREEIKQLRSHIRYLKQTLFSDNRMPSVSDIYERIILDNKIQKYKIFFEKIKNEIQILEDYSKKWNDIQSKIKNLPDNNLSERDTNKLDVWKKYLREQLKDYGFCSLRVDQIDLSYFSYRPESEGFDLQTAISASDLIRTIWAYLGGLLEVSRYENTNHLGCLLFDEPRQQSTHDLSFGKLLKRASLSADFNQQIIFFTSENRDKLNEHLLNTKHTIYEIEGRIIKKL